MAKQLICERLGLTLPAWDGADGMPNPPTATDSRGAKLLGKRVEYPARSVQLRSARAEASIADYRPDVLAEDDEGELLIEIRVSHAVTGQKTRNVQSEGRRMIEIDLSSVSAQQAEDPKAFEALVLDTARNRSWISCPPATEAWRAARDALAVRLATKNRKIAKNQGRRNELARLRAQKEQEREIWRNRTRMELREPYLEDLHYLLQASRPEAIAAKNALLQRRDEDKAIRLLAMIHDDLHPALRSSSGPAWAYQAHYLLWQPAMYLHFIDGKPAGHPISRSELGRWLRATYGVDPVLWRLFMAQWIGRKEARQLGQKRWSLSLWHFTEEENRAVPNFFECVTGLVDRLIVAGALERDDEPGGDLVVSAPPSDGAPTASRKPLPSSRLVDPLLETGVDPYIDRWISHARLGVGIIRRRVAKGSPTYSVWFNNSNWRTVWLGDPECGQWKIRDKQDACDQSPSSPDSGGP